MKKRGLVFILKLRINERWKEARSLRSQRNFTLQDNCLAFLSFEWMCQVEKGLCSKEDFDILSAVVSNHQFVSLEEYAGTVVTHSSVSLLLC